MSDLDEEELKATRKMNGASKEIEVGEFIRTNKGNFARTILVCSEDYYAGEVIRATYKCDNGKKYDYKNINSEFYKGINQYLLKEEMIVKHSKNITDLIEVGDIVEVPKVYGEKGTILYHMIDKQYTESFTRNLKVEYIKTILTKEQYSQNCFRLEE